MPTRFCLFRFIIKITWTLLFAAKNTRLWFTPELKEIWAKSQTSFQYFSRRGRPYLAGGISVPSYSCASGLTQHIGNFRSSPEDFSVRYQNLMSAPVFVCASVPAGSFLLASIWPGHAFLFSTWKMAWNGRFSHACCCGKNFGMYVMLQRFYIVYFGCMFCC